MAGTRKAPLWRQVFLRALRRTGNVRASAFEAGVDPGTAYDHRAKDAGFRAKWAGVLKGFRAAEKKRAPLRHPAGGPPRRSGEELVLRRSKHGDKLVRAAPGRWSRRVEESFLDGLEATGCVRVAAAAAGLSTNALYGRRAKYPEFAARWDERAARAATQLPGVLSAAALESLAPDVPGAKRRGRARLPKMNVDQAIRVKVSNDNAEARRRGPARRGGVSSQESRPQCSEAEEKEELVETFVRLIGMMKRRRVAERRRDGWTDCGSGIWVPPGWVVKKPPADGSGARPEGPGDGGPGT